MVTGDGVIVTDYGTDENDNTINVEFPVTTGTCYVFECTASDPSSCNGYALCGTTVDNGALAIEFCIDSSGSCTGPSGGGTPITTSTVELELNDENGEGLGDGAVWRYLC